MTDKVQKIKDWISKEQEGLMDAQGNFEYPEHQGAYDVLCNLDAYIDSLQEEPVSEDLEKEMDNYLPTVFSKDMDGGEPRFTTWFKALRKTAIYFANWQKENLWKSADGDDLPILDREVIVLCKNGRVAFGHRPFEKFKARPIGYGRTEEYEVKTYDKGGWNIPDIKYWLDIELPKE